MSDRSKDVVSTRAPEPVGAFPHAKRVGDFLFLSGIGPRRRGTKDIPSTFEAQVLAVFENVRTVLEDAGASWTLRCALIRNATRRSGPRASCILSGAAAEPHDGRGGALQRRSTSN